MNEQFAPLNQEQMTARIKELYQLIAEHRQEITKLEREMRHYEQERLALAPRGTYLHHRADGSDIEVEAAVLETSGEAKCIQYQIPKWLSKSGEEDAYIRWLRSPEQLARFSPAK